MDQFTDLDDLTESGLMVSYFAMQYILELWELDGVCHPDCSERFMEHSGAFLVEVSVLKKLWQSSQVA
jgi:hypothetical protein